MRVVLDTNMWVSGLLQPKSMAGKILEAWRRSALTVVVSQQLLDEIKRVLSYPKINKRLAWTPEQIEQYVILIMFSAECVFVSQVHVLVETDPDDSVILATLLESKADYLVTGDNDLKHYADVYPIISLVDFYNKFNFQYD